ncbi:MAG: hypothetical protein QG664_687 [Patescibacteria group bacterium]|nr:hypothetical protein [Nitrospira sp.]MDQ5976774.1 hypothetical protein [Patescibacteria group bacterium]
MDAFLQRQWRYNLAFLICSALAIFLAGVAVTLTVMNKAAGYSSGAPVRVQSGPTIRAQQQGDADGGAQVARMPQQQIEAPVSRPEPPQLIRAVGTHHPSKSHAYRAYVVKPGETLSRLDPAGWKHTCDINRQFGSIKKADCTLTADAAILLPVAVVESMTLAAVDSPAAPSERIAQTEIRKRLSQTDRLHLAEKARWQFCDHTGNERSSACESERAANFEMLVLSLQRSSDRT